MDKRKGCVGIIARLGSKRLNDKHLIEINNHSIISIMLWFSRNLKKQGVVYNWLEYNF